MSISPVKLSVCLYTVGYTFCLSIPVFSTLLIFEQGPYLNRFQQDWILILVGEKIFFMATDTL